MPARILTCICLLGLSVCFGQSPHLVFRHLDRSTGLPVDKVNCLTQDSSGFIWMGTPEGLYRYDGFRFTSFADVSVGMRASLGQHIASLYVDRQGFIWVCASYGGVVVLNSSGTVLDVLNSQVNPSFTGDRSTFIGGDSKGRIWCSSENGLYQLALKNGKISLVRKVSLRQYGHTTDIVGPYEFDRSGQMWLCTFRGLVVYDPDRNTLFYKGHNPQQLPFLDDSTSAGRIFVDEQKGKVWYSNWAPSLRVFDQASGQVITLYSGKGSPRPDFWKMANQFFPDRRGRMWIASGWGLDLARTDLLGVEQQIRNEPGTRTAIGGVSGIMEDREGNFWLATETGILLTAPYEEQFRNLSTNAAQSYAFADKHVSSIVVIDSNTRLVGTFNADGIYETDSTFRIRKHFSFHSANYDWVWDFYHDREHRKVYVCTQRGMLLYDCRTHSIRKMTEPPFDRFLPVSSIVRDRDGMLWMSRYKDELIRYDPRNNTWQRFPLTQFGLAPQIIRLAMDKDDQLWILCNNSGLYRVDRKTFRITASILPRKGESQSLLQPEVTAFRDLGDYFLIGYDQKGFSLYDKKTKRFEHYNRSQGLAGNRVNDILPTPDGNVWLATSNGISCFRPTSRELVGYNYDNGILNNNVGMLCPLPDGQLAAGTELGMVLFHPGNVLAPPRLPPPFITGISVYGRKLDSDSIQEKNVLNISYKQNYFSLDYLCPQYNRRDQIEYAYQLEGFDPGWIAAGTRRFASYANLDAGSFTFRLRARLPGSDWVESTTRLQIHVDAPFYNQWWFIPACALLFAVLVYGLFRYRVRQLVRLERMRAAISSDLHDEVGATLSSISIFSEMARKSVETDSRAEQYLQRIGDRSRDSIEKMSDIIWSINPNNDSLEQMLTRMKSFVNESVEARDIRVHWIENRQIADLKLGMEERKNLYLLFKEAVINAVKYSGAQNLEIRLTAQNREVSLCISDDGKGFSPEAVRQGNGIRNMKQRAEQLKGSVRIHSVQGAGTSISLSFKTRAQA